MRVQTRDITHVCRADDGSSTTPARDENGAASPFGWRYVYPNGTYVKSQTIMIDGKIYRFGSDGFMRTGHDEGAWRYHDSFRCHADRFANVEGGWYYLMPEVGATIRAG